MTLFVGRHSNAMQVVAEGCFTRYFEREFSLVESTQLPMFLHCRNAHGDFTGQSQPVGLCLSRIHMANCILCLIDIIRRNWGKMKGGVVHSFTGSIEEAKALTDVGLYIGINGWSACPPELFSPCLVN